MKYFKFLTIFLVVFNFVHYADAICLSKCQAQKRRAKEVKSTLNEHSDTIDKANSNSHGAQQESSSIGDMSGSDAGADSKLTANLSMIAGVIATGAALKKVPKCISTGSGCGEMAILLSQGLSMFGQASSASGAAFSISGGTSGGTPVDDSFLEDDGSGLAEPALEAMKSGLEEDFLSVGTLAEAKIDAALAQLKDKGYSVDKESGAVTDSNGNSISANPNSASLKSTADKIAKTIDSFKDQDDKLRGGANSFASTGGSGAEGGSSSIIYEDEYGSGARGLASSDGKKKRKDEFLAGLSDGSKGGIGVAGDDIFEMMTRRYTKKIKSREFILKK